MAKYISEPYLQDIVLKHVLIKNLKNLSKKEKNAYEYERLLASYYLVEVCSGLEHAAKSTVRDVVSKIIGPTSLKSFLLESRFLSSVHHSQICEFLAQIDPKIKTDYMQRVKGREISDMEALYNHRQRIVHYGESHGGSLTIKDVDEKRQHASWLIRKMETSIKKAF